jgi:hypothetical protein
MANLLSFPRRHNPFLLEGDRASEVAGEEVGWVTVETTFVVLRDEAPR